MADPAGGRGHGPSKRRAPGLLAWLLILHVCGTAPAFLYFSWLYAQQHGLISWLFLGELGPLGQSMVWEYYVAAGVVRAVSGHEWTDRDAEGAAHLRASIDEASRAYEMLSRHAALSPDERRQVARHLDRALAEAELVPESTLGKIHTQLPARFMTEHKAAIESFREAKVAGDRRQALRHAANAQRLSRQWNAWYEAHRREFAWPPGVAGEP